jgi:phage terminase small subunit
MPGPGKKPHALKLVAGTDRKDRAPAIAPVELPLVSEVPDAPDWMPNPHAVKEWNRLAPILHAVGLLTDGGLSALGKLCALHGKLVQLWAAGESPTGHMLAQYRAMVNDFGLTPVAQGKVRGNGDTSKPGNRFAGRKQPA